MKQKIRFSSAGRNARGELKINACNSQIEQLMIDNAFDRALSLRPGPIGKIQQAFDCLIFLVSPLRKGH
jgi:hypothetical protein